MLARWVAPMLLGLLALAPAHAKDSKDMADKHWSLAIHGGAGTITRDRLTEAQRAEIEAGLDEVEAGLLAGALTGADDVAGVLGVDAAGVLDAGVLLGLDAEFDGLLLHAVIASATMPVAAMACAVFFTTPPGLFADRSIRGRASLGTGGRLVPARRLCA